MSSARLLSALVLLAMMLQQSDAQGNASLHVRKCRPSF